MSKFIYTDEYLRALLPGVQNTMPGQTPFLEKLTPFLQSSAERLRKMFPLFRPDSEAGHRAIAYDALVTAIPTLDLILTPNGFGVVSSANVAPASRERVERLLQTLTLSRDRALHCALAPGAELFPGLGVCMACGEPEPSLEKYLELSPRLKTLETELVEDWLGEPLYYGELLNNPEDYPSVVHSLRLTVADALRTGAPMDRHRLMHLVDTVRKDPALFLVWQQGGAYSRFCQNPFQNEKKASGYFF